MTEAGPAGAPFPEGTLGAEGLACVRSERVVFLDLSFTVRSGEALVLRGPNGSGKSSLLRLIAGLLPAADGTLTWNGTSVRADRDAHRARLDYVGHVDAVKAALSVRENLEFWAALAGKTGAETAALKRFGLIELADLPARFLSAGQQRRLNLARLGASGAALWLLDEPAVSLDQPSVLALHDLIQAHRTRGGISVIASHGDIEVEGARILHLGPQGTAP